MMSKVIHLYSDLKCVGKNAFYEKTTMKYSNDNSLWVLTYIFFYLSLNCLTVPTVLTIKSHQYYILKQMSKIIIKPI